MEGNEDIIDVLYRCHQPPSVQPTQISHTNNILTGGTDPPNQTYSDTKTSPHCWTPAERRPRPPRSFSSTPTVSSRYNEGAVRAATGRTGYNNTPLVRRRRDSLGTFSPPRPPLLPRSVSAYESHEFYCSRARMVDVLHSEDERQEREQDVVQLPSGVRQRLPRGRHPGSEGGVRKRKLPSKQADARGGDNKSSAQVSASQTKVYIAVNNIVGCLVMIWLSYQFSRYLYQLHENDMWFSEIMEVEREISFRTEQGLYYSYFKQLVHAPSLEEGFLQLKYDNRTESTRTINIFERFNIYQELVLAALYKIYTFRLSPIFFYTYAVFWLQGVFLASLYLLAWSMTGSWLAGVLTAVSVLVNRFDVTRVNFTVPLREHFSLPFIFLQFLVVGRHLAHTTVRAPSWQSWTLLASIYFTSLIFTISWQFSQFVLLIEVLVLFCLATVGLIDRDRVCVVFSTFLVTLLTVWYLQFYQSMIITSLVVSFLPVFCLSLQSQSDLSPIGLRNNILVTALRLLVAFFIALCLNVILKVWMNQTADNHIFKFVKNKFTTDSTDFESQLYLCNEAFQWLDSSFYERMNGSLVLPIYVVFCAVCGLSYITITFIRWSSPQIETNHHQETPVLTRTDSRATIYKSQASSPGQVPVRTESWFLNQTDQRPDLCLHVGLSVALGVLAISTLRMKCFWSPYICALSSVAVADTTLWTVLLSKVSRYSSQRTVNIARHAALLCLICVLLSKHKPIYEQEMTELREFYDPDTVDLMQWLQQKTDKDAVISGSMQLMAGVKLCSNRAITNHPHFEDQDLRDRTKHVYQMYAKTSPKEVHSILRKYNTNYIILEDSICLAHRNRCSLPDIMDLTNGHIPDDGIVNPPHLVRSKYPRFCEEVRYDNPAYRKFFTKVFENKTFRIFKVLS